MRKLMAFEFNPKYRKCKLTVLTVSCSLDQYDRRKGKPNVSIAGFAIVFNCHTAMRQTYTLMTK